jgi:phage terminase small subunit
MARELTEKQRRFAQEYVLDLNATQAAIRAKYSKKTSEQIGYQLLQLSSVKAEIDRLLSSKTKKLDLSLENILSEYMRYAFVDHERSLAVDFTSDRLKALKELHDHLEKGKNAGANSSDFGDAAGAIGQALIGLASARKAS